MNPFARLNEIVEESCEIAHKMAKFYVAADILFPSTSEDGGYNTAKYEVIESNPEWKVLSERRQELDRERMAILVEAAYQLPLRYRSP